LRPRDEEAVKEAEVEKEVEEGSKQMSTKKAPRKRQTEMERLEPVQDERKLRRTSRVKDSREAFTRGKDDANEADVEGGETDQDVSESTESWWRCQHADGNTGCWCTTWESLGRPAIWKGDVGSRVSAQD